MGFRTAQTRIVMVACFLAAVPLGLASSQASANDSIIRLPAPSGPYAIGYRRFELVDSNRTETQGRRRGPRRIVVHAWYPARDREGPRASYMDSITARAWAEAHRLPLGFQHNVVVGAALAPAILDTVAALPVLLFSHGRAWPVLTYQAMLHDLASRGWVIAGISHPHQELTTPFADGSVAQLDRDLPPEQPARGKALSLEVDVLVQDARHVLNALARWNGAANHPFQKALDLTRVGYFGHSLGGSAAAHALGRDPRILAAATIEGSVFDSVARPLRVDRPLLSIIGGYNENELSLRDFRPGPTGVVYEALVRGAWHASFADLLHVYGATASPQWRRNHRRELSPVRVNQITTDYLDAFFARYLEGKPSILLRPHSPQDLGSYLTSGYPEVELRIVVY